MALKQLILSKRIEEARSQLNELETAWADLETRRAELQTREDTLTDSLNEVTEETSDEDKATLDAEMGKWEADDAALSEEEKENAEKRQELQSKIDELNKELEELNTRALTPVKTPEKIRKDEKIMNRAFFGMSEEQRSALFAREDMKNFISTVRAAGKEHRAITNAGLLIPDVLLPIMRQITAEASKLYKYVNVRQVPGTARQNIMGDIPEAVWTEMCANLNEMTLSFNQVEVDGYKVGGYIAVCNAILEDADDVALATEVLNAIGKGIGLALDKAILYGTGTKMPLGIVTRLAQTAAPEDYSAVAPTWVDLHTTNMLKIAATVTGADLFKALVKDSGAITNKYSNGQKFWVMNPKTHLALVAEALSINAAGAIVSGQNGTMPIVGGDIVELDFVPDNVIIGGYGEQYLLAERAGTQLATSEHYRFVQDQTVFRGTARYDGMPVIAGAFMTIGLSNTTVAANAVTFAADTANT